MQLLDRLLRLTYDVDNPVPRTLEQLPGNWCADDGLDASLATADPAAAVWCVHQRQIEAAAPLQIDEDRTARFGPLSLAVQVQGAIVVAATEQRGLTLSRDTAHHLRTEARSWIAAHSRTLRTDREARACFRWDAGGEVERDGRGRPRVHEDRLSRWLEQRADALRGEGGFGFRVPRTERGDVDGGPGRWGEFTLFDPLLRAWAELTEACELEHRLDDVAGELTIQLRPRYELLPRIRSWNPNVEFLVALAERAGVPLVEPAPGRRLLVAELPDLLVRCLAVNNRRHVPGGSALANAYYAGDDPVAHAAARLAWGESDGGPSGLITRDAIEDWAGRDSVEFTRWLTLTRALFEGLIHGMTADRIACLISCRCRDGTSVAEVEGLLRRLRRLAWELDEQHLEDRTWDLLEERMYGGPGDWNGLDLMAQQAWRRGLYDALGVYDEPDWGQSGLRNVLAGRTHSPDVIRALRELNRNPDLAQYLEGDRGSEELAFTVLGQSPLVLTGRFDPPRMGFDVRRAEVVNLADDVLKAASFAVVREGLLPVVWAEGLIVLEADGDTDAAEVCRQVEQTAVRGAQTVLGAFPVACMCRPVEAWPERRAPPA